MLCNFSPPDTIEIIHCGVQPNGSGYVRSTRLKPMRPFFPGALKEINSQNHFAASLVRRHGFQNLLAHKQNPYTGRTTHLMAGKCQEIATEFPDIHRAMAG